MVSQSDGVTLRAQILSGSAVVKVVIKLHDASTYRMDNLAPWSSRGPLTSDMRIKPGVSRVKCTLCSVHLHMRFPGMDVHCVSIRARMLRLQFSMYAWSARGWLCFDMRTTGLQKVCGSLPDCSMCVALFFSLCRRKAYLHICFASKIQPALL